MIVTGAEAVLAITAAAALAAWVGQLRGWYKGFRAGQRMYGTTACAACKQKHRTIEDLLGTPAMLRSHGESP